MNKNMLLLYVLACCFIPFILTSCKKTDVVSQTPPQQGNPVDPCAGQPGALFTAVKAVITQNCVGCHNNTNSQGGMNWTVDCNIVTNKARIKARAVDQGTMPPTGPLSQADKDKITAWINAGGAITN
jgi:uncharacterized membrane protein